MKTLEQFVDENLYDDFGNLEINIPNHSFINALDSALSEITGKRLNSDDDIKAHFTNDEFGKFKENLSKQLRNENIAYINGVLDILYTQWIKEVRKQGGGKKDIDMLKADFDFDMKIHNILDSFFGE